MRIPWRIRRINSRGMDNAGTEMEQNWCKEVFLCQKSLVIVNLGEVVSLGFLNLKAVILKEIAVFFIGA